MQSLLGFLVIILFIGLGIFQLVVGYQGIEYNLGAGWAIASLVATFVFRFTLPITIGSYFGAVDVLGWHWGIGLLLAAPGLLFIVPGITLTVLNSIRSKILSKKTVE
jgi:thiosulfate reductase cytochrome b subunit